MARVNALRAKSAENEKAKEAAKQAVSSQETFIRIFFFPTKQLQILSVLTQRLDTSQQMTL